MSAKVPSVDGTFDCDPQACFLDVVYHDIYAHTALKGAQFLFLFVAIKAVTYF